MADARPVIREARAEDLPAIAAYLAPRLGGPGGEGRFRRFLDYAWLPDRPNLGFLIDDGGRIGGFVGAIWARRRVRSGLQLFCNLTSLHVEEPFRLLTLALVGRLVSRRDVTFTTCSPSDRVVDVLRFFKFQVLDPEKTVFAPISGLGRVARRPRARTFRAEDVAARLTDEERRVFQDHRPYRCGQFLVERGGDRCYFVTVRRGRGVRAFADVLHASNPDLLAETIATTHVPVGLTHGTVLTAIDRRLLKRRPPVAFSYRGSRPLMFRSDFVEAHEIDALYSELVPMYG